jgi:hypothetical protein
MKSPKVCSNGQNQNDGAPGFGHITPRHDNHPKQENEDELCPRNPVDQIPDKLMHLRVRF